MSFWRGFCWKGSAKGSAGRLSSCSKCKEAHYCSRECQVVHWKSHKSICVAIRAHPNGPKIIQSGNVASWKLNENKEFWLSTDGMHYAGDIMNELAHGRGTMKCPDGMVYGSLLVLSSIIL